MSFTNWNDQVLQLLKSIRDNSAPVGEGSGAVNIKVSDVLVSDAQVVPIGDNGGSITVDGAVQVVNFPATQVVSGVVQVANLPATQVVSGVVEVANFPATQVVSGTVTLTNEPNEALLNYANFGTTNAAVVQVGTAHLFSLSCYNSKDCKRFFQLFDKATAPITGDIPVESYAVGSECELEKTIAYFGSLGRKFTNGLAWGFSMSLETFSPATASDQTTHLKFR